ncbi:MAG: hypothetical protein HC900_00165 [Methylacidiphilales bacterium]|nr:hypothetical protein [Candidatus Methylacidiphilales bacterium]
MAEADTMRRLQAAASALGARLFRQQVGMAWVGNHVERITAAGVRSVRPGDVIIRAARPFHAGVEGMSDLGGWVPVVVAPEMVGQAIAVVAQVEVKAGTRLTKQQGAWIAAVNAAGGRAGVAHDEAELAQILGLSATAAP